MSNMIDGWGAQILRKLAGSCLLGLTLGVGVAGLQAAELPADLAYEQVHSLVAAVATADGAILARLSEDGELIIEEGYGDPFIAGVRWPPIPRETFTTLTARLNRLGVDRAYSRFLFVVLRPSRRGTTALSPLSPDYAFVASRIISPDGKVYVDWALGTQPEIVDQRTPDVTSLQALLRSALEERERFERAFSEPTAYRVEALKALLADYLRTSIGWPTSPQNWAWSDAADLAKAMMHFLAQEGAPGIAALGELLQQHGQELSVRQCMEIEQVMGYKGPCGRSTPEVHAGKVKVPAQP